MQHPKLFVGSRILLGKKVKKLRKTGVIPANIYGKALTSIAVEVAEKDFKPLYKEVGETGLVDVQLEGTTHPILIHNVQIDPLTKRYLHADFYQVNLKEKIKATVPLVITGEPKAVVDKVGLLLQTLSDVEIEALPEELPENIEVNVEPLAELDDQITIGELKAPAGVTIHTDASQVVAKITELVSKEAEEQAAQEQAAAQAAKAEGAEGEQAPAEGEAAPTPEEKTGA